MRWAKRAGCVVSVVAALAGCGKATHSYVTIPLAARQSDLARSYRLLHDRGLLVSVAGPTSISSLEGAGVGRLSPPIGARVARGATVTITPLHGPLGSPAVAAGHPHYRVPDFTGKKVGAAVSWANKHEMFWAVPKLPALHASDAPQLLDAYRIVSQTPKPGDTIVQGVMHGRGFHPTPLTLTVAVA